MVRTSFFWCLLLLFAFSPVLGQIPQIALRSESSIRKHADIYFERQAYSHAAKLYHRLATNYPDDSEVQFRLGDCYRLLREPATAAHWYSRALKEDQSSTEHLFHYASVLCASKKYQLAKHWYQAYLKREPDDQRAINAIESLIKPQNLFDSRYEAKPMQIDLPGAVFSPVIVGDGLVFVGEGSTGSLVKKITTWQEGPYYDLYYVPIDKPWRCWFPQILR